MDEKQKEALRRMRDLPNLNLEEGLEVVLEWVRGQDIEVQMALFREWTEAERGNQKFRKKLIQEAFNAWKAPGPDTFGMERHFDAVFMKKYDQPSDRVALVYMGQIKAPYKMRGLFIKAAVRAKRRVYTRLYMRRARGSKKTGAPASFLKAPMPALTVRAVPAGAALVETAGDGRILPPPHGRDIWDQVPEYKIRIERKATPEDFERVLAPCRESLLAAGLGEMVEHLLQLLHENGDCSSVMGKSYDIEYEKLKHYPDKRLLDALGKVSLYDHTLHVLEYATAAIANDERGHLHWFAPAIVTAALGHDIGKMPAVRERGRKGMADHAAISRTELKSMFPPGINTEINAQIRAAVYYHHTNVVATSPAQVIMEADARARVREISEAYPIYTSGKRIDEWLDPGRFADVVSRAINESIQVNVWKAMSFNGVVYCMLEFARTVIKKLGAAANILDWRLVREINPMDTRAVLTELADLLRARGVLAWSIEHPYFGSYFLFHARIANMSERKYYCIPINQAFFPGSPEEIESRKRGYLKLVFDVQPTRGH